MGKNTDMLIESVKDIWDGYDRHPFVTGIADGTLDKEKFKYYMIQDYLYLIDYAKVFALGVAKASDKETMRHCAGYVDQILDGEMDIHRGYMKRLGISLEEAEHTPLALDNLSYTSYMLRMAYEGGAAEVLVAILSCAVSYEFIAKHIVANNPAAADHEFYGEWIRGYVSDEYAEANKILIDLTERLTADLNDAQLEHLKQIFINCSRYEGSFWDMAWEMRG
ncbi:MAG: thiaminase II [Lachnospiraceae bacterium]|nr:thiaminase II [Lachnospiraceae bacterium]